MRFYDFKDWNKGFKDHTHVTTSVVVRTITNRDQDLTETRVCRHRNKTKTLSFPLISGWWYTFNIFPAVSVSTAMQNLHSAKCFLLYVALHYEFSVIKEPNLEESKNLTTFDFRYWLHLKKKVLHPITVITLTNKSFVVLTENPEFGTSETETFKKWLWDQDRSWALQHKLLHVIVLWQHWPHIYPKIALSRRYHACSQFINSQ